MAEYFEIGDRVEFHKGGTGTVFEVYEGGCGVEWDDWVLRDNPWNSDSPEKGPNQSRSLPRAKPNLVIKPLEN